MDVQTSPSFKKEAKKTIFSILVFAFTYLLLFILSIGLTAACIYAGITVIAAAPSIPTLGLGLALIASAFTVLIYLIKFIFASSKTDLSHLTEIKASDEPRLFALIAEIVEEVDTKFPKKVYLSHDVNASVFYDSNFWSMFLPIRKNLQIGMGLVNSVTHQELKAILAHEFGHFSQKSMKVGSYVYNVNQIIYNMLYKNESLNKMNEKWASINGYAMIFIGISAFIIKGIQKILQQLYSYININYMALSREMEFHADEIAANVAGSKALSESLLRLSFSNFALENVLNFYDDRVKLNVKSPNLYTEQQLVMQFLAKKNKYPVRGAFPVIELEQIKKYNKSKLNIENQWASHPSDEDRINALNALNIIKANTDDSPAIALFEDNGAIAKHISNALFAHIQYTEVPNELNPEKFTEEFIADFEQNAFDDLYNGFYDSNNPIIENLALVDKSIVEIDVQELFSDEKIESIYELAALKNDKEALIAIQNGEIKIKTFDYASVKHPVQETHFVLQQIEKEIAEKEMEIKTNNIAVFRYFYTLARAQNKEEELYRLYAQFVKIDQQYDEKIKFHNTLIETTSFIFQVTPFDEITTHLEDVKKLEPKLKNELSLLLQTPLVTDKLDESIKNTLQTYTGNTLHYFDVDTYDDDNLTVLFSAINHYQQLIVRQYFLKKQEILKFQKALL
ncbi:M48 family metallopeptidase [Sphingobacterium olei]|nr:M48 family metallopeptidase [Sphingobacterium olei]